MVKDYFVRVRFCFFYVCIPYGSNIVNLPAAAGPHTQIFADLFSQSEWTLDSLPYRFCSTETQIQTPKLGTVAGRNACLTGRNLKRDQANVGLPGRGGDEGESEEKKNTHTHVNHNRSQPISFLVSEDLVYVTNSC